jgi:hypothetical protein
MQNTIAAIKVKAMPILNPNNKAVLEFEKYSLKTLS